MSLDSAQINTEKIRVAPDDPANLNTAKYYLYHMNTTYTVENLLQRVQYDQLGLIKIPFSLRSIYSLEGK